jgi:hypothetical protein
MTWIERKAVVADLIAVAAPRGCLRGSFLLDGHAGVAIRAKRLQVIEIEEQPFVALVPTDVVRV